MDDSDEALMARVARGDERAFQALARRHLPAMLGLARRILGNAAEAEDVAQEALMRVWTHAPRWRPLALFRTWLTRVVVNLCLDRKRRAPWVELEAAGEIVDPSPGATEKAEANERERMVDEGNYVRSADTNSSIVVITQLQPISVLFNLPQQDLSQVNSAFEKGPLNVEAQRSDNDAVIDRGVLRVVDNQVDQTTGTVKLKAEFPNANLQLWPGQFVNIRLLVNTLKQVVVIPTGAVQRGPNGTFVYVVKDDDTITVRPITVQKQDETQTVVGKGLEPAERVVTTGFVRLTEGSKVTIGSADASTAQPAGPRPQGPGSGRRQRGGSSARPSPQQ